MNSDLITKFTPISIRGRYIYAYLCLLSIMEADNIPPLPEKLNKTLKEFVSSSRLDNWQSEVEEFLPSIVLENYNNQSYFEFLSFKEVQYLKEFYSSQTLDFSKALETIIWLGMSNIYGGYNSNYTMEYLVEIIILCKSKNLPLPNFKLIENCSSDEDRGWGYKTDMKYFI